MHVKTYIKYRKRFSFRTDEENKVGIG